MIRVVRGCGEVGCRGQVQGWLGVFGIGDSPLLLAAYNQYVQDKEAYDAMMKRQKEFESKTGEFALNDTATDTSVADPNDRRRHCSGAGEGRVRVDHDEGEVEGRRRR